VFFLINAYNLQTNFSASGVGISCVGFPFLVCGAPLALPTRAGDSILYQTPNICCPPSTVFTAQVQSVTFSAFTARAEISGTPPTSFQIYGSFTLDASSNGINPLS
jgi:hypothetical protein